MLVGGTSVLGQMLVIRQIQAIFRLRAYLRNLMTLSRQTISSIAHQSARQVESLTADWSGS